MKIYSRYSRAAVNKEIIALMKLDMVKDKVIKPESLVMLYTYYRYNLKQLETVFPFKKIDIFEMSQLPEGDRWKWFNREEKLLTMKDIASNGLISPFVVMEKDVKHISDDPNKYDLVDGNHRRDALKGLIEVGDFESGIVPTYVMPEYCINVRERCKEGLYVGEEYEVDNAIDMYILPHMINKLNISDLEYTYADNSNAIAKVHLKNKLELYNIAFSIGHELSIHMYLYYKKYGTYPLRIRENMFNIT